MRQTRWLSLLLALALSLSLALPAAAAETGEPLLPDVRTYGGQFPDLAGAWCAEEAVAAYEAGLMEGASADRFDIRSSLTCAQITVIAARLHDLLTGGDGVLDAAAPGEAWYQPAADHLAAALADADSDAAVYLLGDLETLAASADQPCDRYDFVWYLAAVLPEEALAPINDISSLPDVTDSDVLRFYRAGILTGSDDKGTFNGSDPINRGQAAAILARIADPARRVSFAPEVPSYTREALGLEPDTVLLTVDGYDVTAEMFFYFLAANIQSMEDAQSDSDDYYTAYPLYFQEYLADTAYTGSFADYLLEKHGIDVHPPVDWDAPDKGGMTPAQKVLTDTLGDAKELAVLLARREAFPLTSAQEAELEDYLAEWGISYGFSEAFCREMLTAAYLSENLSQDSRVSAAELAALLADEGYLYGQYVAVYRGDRNVHESDEAARAAAEEVRQKLIAHLSDPEYVEFLIWKYSEDYNVAPDLLPINVLSGASFQTLKGLSPGRVSPVLEEDHAYMVVIKLDPTEDPELVDSVSSLAAQARLSQWAEEARVAVSPACDAVDVAAAAQVLKDLDI